jgi:hypothetical protein
MGFGILFIGFMLTYFGAFTPLYVFTYAIGTIVIIYSLKNLISEFICFLVSCVIGCILEVLSLVLLIFYVADKQNGIYNILCSVQTYISTALLIALLFSIYKIAKKVGLIKIQSKVIADGVILLIGVVSSVLIFIVKNSNFSKYAAVISAFAQIIYVIFTLVIIFNCYVRICYYGDEDMSNQNTGMNFLNTLNTKLNKAMDKDENLNDKKDRKK